MTSDNSDLSPCPFCGGGETRVYETKTRASVLEQYEVMGAYVQHWCGGFARGAQSATIQVRGRNHSDAIAAWNRRSVPFVPPAEVERLRGEMPVADSLRIAAECAQIERDEARAVVLEQAKENADLRAAVERLRAEMLELAEWCEAEEPLSHKKLSYRLRYALEAKP